MVTFNYKTLLMAETPESSGCRNGTSLDVLKQKDEKSFEEIISKACEQPKFFNSEGNIREINRIHDKTYCMNISTCANQRVIEAAALNAKTFIQDHLDEIVFTGQLNRTLYKNKGVCGIVKPSSNCEELIKKTFSIQGDESASSFIYKKFINKDKSDPTNCYNKLDINDICTKQENRVSEIKQCFSNPKGTECLSFEQFAVRPYLNSLLIQDSDQNKIGKRNLILYYALERELCSSKNIIQNATHWSKSHLRTEGSNEVDVSIAEAVKEKTSDTNSKYIANVDDSIAPDYSSVKTNGKRLSFLKDASKDARMDGSGVDIDADSKSFGKLKNNDTSLIDSFAADLSHPAQDNLRVNPKGDVSVGGVGSTSWNASAADRFNAINNQLTTTDEGIPRENGLGSKGDAKAKDDTNNLLNQIEMLKNKLSDMNDKLQTLKETPKNTADTNNKITEINSNEKAILDLKNQLAALEKEKKARLETLDQDSKNDTQRDATQRGYSPRSTILSNDDGETHSIRNEHDENSYTNGSPQNFTSEGSRSPASTFTSQGTSSGGNNSSIVLRSTAFQNSNDSSIVYMTDGEIKDYPFRLAASASNLEIERMIIGNKGVSVIIGDSEKIVPIMENGVIQLDDEGRVKFKRLKISLVKNEKEKALNINREVTSIADLKKEEQKNRDIIRYQDMKKGIKLK